MKREGSASSIPASPEAVAGGEGALAVPAFALAADVDDHHHQVQLPQGGGRTVPGLSFDALDFDPACVFDLDAAAVATSSATAAKAADVNRILAMLADELDAPIFSANAEATRQASPSGADASLSMWAASLLSSDDEEEAAIAATCVSSSGGDNGKLAKTASTPPKKKRAAPAPTSAPMSAPASSETASEDDGSSSTADKPKRSKLQTSKFRGVSRCTKDGRWQARIRVKSGVTYLGRFANEEDAARRYDEAARVCHGKMAVLNFCTPEDRAAGLKGVFDAVGGAAMAVGGGIEASSA